MPSVDEVAQKLCHPFSFGKIASYWLIRHGYRDKDSLTQGT